jgi:GNAT superfamily N-acetyltransferase
MTELLTPHNEQADSSPKERLEAASWAPWLRFDGYQLSKQKEIFPEGQFTAKGEDGSLLGFLSTNRISWDGSANSLPTWDQIAGPSSTYEETYRPDGNTLVLMSMSVSQEARGKGIPGLLIGQLKDYAAKNDVEKIIGDFRPSGFGLYKKTTGDLNFENYCRLAREDGKLSDGWLRSVQKMGMQELRPDPRSMVVSAMLDEFEAYKASYNPDNWWQVKDKKQLEYLLGWHRPDNELQSIDEVWECEEAGTWYVDRSNGRAAYIESNLWGSLPIEEARYDLTPEQIEYEEKKLVNEVRERVGDKQGVWGVWLPAKMPAANMIRTWETEYFPELPDVVNDEVENDSLFYALVDTREDEGRIIHAARITGVGHEPFSNKDEVSKIQNSQHTETPFAGMNELISAGVFTADEFYTYYQSKGIDLTKCVAVETNFRVGKKAERFNGLSGAEIAYLAFFRLVEKKQPGFDQGGVFASINRASLISFKRVGLDYEPILGRDDLRYPAPDGNGKDFYTPVLLPYRQKNIELFGSIGSLTPNELYF